MTKLGLCVGADCLRLPAGFAAPALAALLCSGTELAVQVLSPSLPCAGTDAACPLLSNSTWWRLHGWQTLAACHHWQLFPMTASHSLPALSLAVAACCPADVPVGRHLLQTPRTAGSLCCGPMQCQRRWQLPAHAIAVLGLQASCLLQLVPPNLAGCPAG